MLNNQYVLFSCIGTTDPIRGQKDGAMVHIARRYHPGAICLFVTKEMETKSLPYCERTLKYMEEKWDYKPEVLLVRTGIEDPSNLDDLDEPMRKAFLDLHDKYPKAQILVNLSSGTPQMEIILCQLALTKSIRSIGIQVKNPAKKAGVTNRTVHDGYDFEFELENNQDELPDAENRCVFPRLFAIQRERNWQDVRTLMNSRDYGGIIHRSEMILSSEYIEIVRHLYERELLNGKKAREIAKGLPAELNLYPGPREEDKVYWDIIDYWLMMKNLYHAGRYSDFMLRISVLVLYLEEELIKRFLAERRINYDDLMIGVEHQHDWTMSMSKLEEALPDLYQELCKIFRGELSSEPNGSFSVFMYTRLLRCMLADRKQMKFFNSCEKLSQRRNDVAHRLKALSREEFQKAINMDLDAFVRKMENTIHFVFPQCDPEVFDVHDRCMKYMEDNR